MTIEKAIEKAIDGGFPTSKLRTKIENLNKTGIGAPNLVTSYDIEPLVLNPLFWKCLGTAMGWKDLANKNFDIYELRMNLASKTVVQKFTETWRWQMHLFIGHLAEGKDIESFFANL